MEAETALLSAGKRRFDAAFGQPLVDLVDDPGERRRREVRDDPAAGRKAAVAKHQMLAARAHAGGVMNSDPYCRAG